MNKQSLRKLIAENNLERVIENLQTIPIVLNESYNELTLFQSRLKQYKEDLRNGLLLKEEANKAFNTLKHNLLCFIDDLPDDIIEIENKSFRRDIELIISGKVEEFSAEKKDDLMKKLGVMLKVPESEIQLSRIEQKDDNTLALRIQSLNFRELTKLLNSNSPQIEKLKSQFNIKEVQKVKELAIWGVKKSIRFIIFAIVIVAICIVILSMTVYFILDYLEIIPFTK